MREPGCPSWRRPGTSMCSRLDGRPCSSPAPLTAPAGRITALIPLVRPAGIDSRSGNCTSGLARYQWLAYLPPPPHPKLTWYWPGARFTARYLPAFVPSMSSNPSGPKATSDWSAMPTQMSLSGWPDESVTTPAMVAPGCIAASIPVVILPAVRVIGSAEPLLGLVVVVLRSNAASVVAAGELGRIRARLQAAEGVGAVEVGLREDVAVRTDGLDADPFQRMAMRACDHAREPSPWLEVCVHTGTGVGPADADRPELGQEVSGALPEAAGIEIDLVPSAHEPRQPIGAVLAGERRSQSQCLLPALTQIPASACPDEFTALTVPEIVAPRSSAASMCRATFGALDLDGCRVCLQTCAAATTGARSCRCNLSRTRRCTGQKRARAVCNAQPDRSGNRSRRRHQVCVPRRRCRYALAACQTWCEWSRRSHRRASDGR